MRSSNPIVVAIVDNINMSRNHFDALRPWIAETNGTVVDIDVSDLCAPEPPRIYSYPAL